MEQHSFSNTQENGDEAFGGASASLIRNLLLATVVAGATTFSPFVEAKSSTSENAGNNPQIQQLQESYKKAGITGVEVDQTTRIVPVVTVFHNERAVARAQGKVQDLDMSPQRIQFEIDQQFIQGKPFLDKPVSEEGKETTVFISGYAYALAQYMGFKYENGYIEYTSNGEPLKIDMRGEANHPNKNVEIRGLQLQSKLLLCAKEYSGNTILYYLDKNGNRVDISEEKDRERIARHCK